MLSNSKSAEGPPLQTIEPRTPSSVQTNGQTLTCDPTGDRWVVARGEVDGKPLFVSFNRALKRAAHWLYDMHAVVQMPLRSPTPEGLTTNEEAAALNEMEDQLLADLGDDAVFIGRETGRASRVLHFHVMESGPALDTITRWQERFPEYQSTLDVQHDPSWEILHRWE